MISSSDARYGIIDKVRNYMCIGEGYTLKPVDYLVMSGLMEVIYSLLTQKGYVE